LYQPPNTRDIPVNTPADIVTDSQKLVSIFGYWPSFHDAEVWTLSHERTMDGFDVVMVIHLFEMSKEVTDTGHVRLVNHTRVNIRFVDCAESRLEEFNHQNVIAGLSIERAPEGSARELSVSMSSSYGLAGELLCSSIIVCEAQPWVPPFGVYAPKTTD
jgi:hypothetical protein